MNGGQVLTVDAGDACKSEVGHGGRYASVALRILGDDREGVLLCCGLQQAAQFTERVGLRCRDARSAQQVAESLQLTAGDPRDAQCLHFLNREGWHHDLVIGQGHDLADRASQRFDLRDRVHRIEGQVADHVVEQGQAFGAESGGVHGTDALVVLRGGVLRGCGIGGQAIGFSQDGAECIDHGLRLGHGVDRCGTDRGGRQSAVDGKDIDAVHAADARAREVGHRGCCAAVGLGVLRNDAQQSGVDVVDQGLQLRLGAHARAVVGGGLKRRQDAAQVVRMHACDAQGCEIGGRRRGRGAARCTGHDRIHGRGHGFDVGHAVHLGRQGLPDHVVEQALGRSTVGHGCGRCCADGCVGTGRWVDVGRGVGIAAVGFGQDQVVGIHQGLYPDRGVDLHASDGRGGQRALDGGQVARLHTRHASGSKVAQAGRCGASGRAAVSGVGLDHGNGRLLALLGQQDLGMVLLGLRHQCLQFSQGVCTRAGVGAGHHQVQEDRQVVGVQTRQTQSRQAREADGGQWRGRSAQRRQQLQLAGRLRQGLDLGDGVDVGGAEVGDGIVEQGQGGGGQACRCAGADGGVGGCNGVAARCGVAGAAIGLGQDAVVGVDQGLHIAGEGQVGGVNVSRGQGALQRAEVARVHPGDAQQQVVVEDWGRGHCAVVVGKGLNGAQRRSHSIACRLRDEGLQFGQGVDRAAIVGRRCDPCQHEGQVFGRDTRDAQGRKVGHGQGLCWRCACSGGEDGRHARGQGLDLGDGVDPAGGLRTDHGVEQGLLGRAVGKTGSGGGADGAVVGSAGVDARIGIGGCAVGLGQDAVVGIDQALDLGGGVHLRAHHSGGGQSGLDGREVGAGHARDARDLEVAEGGGGGAGSGAGIACIGRNAVDGIADRLSAAGEHAAHQGLQFGDGVHRGAVGGAVVNGGQHIDQRVGCDARDAQRREIAHGQRWRGGSCCSGAHDAGSGAGQGLDLGDGVDVGGAEVGDGIVEQGQGGGGQACRCAGADGGVGGCNGVAARCGVAGAAIGLGQDAVVGVDQGLHIAGEGQVGGVNVSRGQGALQRAEVARVHPGDAQQQVVVEDWGRGHCAVVVGKGLNGAQRRSHSIACRLRDEGLQFGQGVDRAAIVGRRCDPCQHEGQVFGRDTRDAQGRKVGHGQGLCWRCACSGGEDGRHARGQGLDLGDGVDPAGGLRTDHGVEQGLLGRAVGKTGSGGGADGAVVGSAGVDARIGIGGCAVGLGQDAVVGIDQALDLGGGVHLRAHHSGGGQSGLDGREVGAGHARDARDLEVAEGGGGGASSGAGIACIGRNAVDGGIAQGIEGHLLFIRLDGGADHRLQLGLGVDGRTIVGGVRNAGQHAGQVVGRDTGDAQGCKVGCTQIGRGCGHAALGGQRGDGKGGGRQGFDLAHAVHSPCAQVGDGVVEQGLRCRTIGQAGRGGGSDRAVGGGHRVLAGRGVDGCAIGFGQDQAVRIDQGLQLGGGVHLRACDGGAGQRTGQGQAVAVVHTADTGQAEISQGRGGAQGRVAVRIGDDGAQRVVARDRRVHDGLQCGQAVDLCAAV